MVVHGPALFFEDAWYAGGIDVVGAVDNDVPLPLPSSDKISVHVTGDDGNDP